MATEIRAPRLGVTVKKIRIVEWLVNEGATVSEGEPVLVFATDKVQHELEAPTTGTIRLLASVDDECPIGTVIAEIDAADAEAA
jgi:pyruvate/2-oxoglutarate dehydrogenase complex dihydrolipoamide acyltransferase (E2) component